MVTLFQAWSGFCNWWANGLEKHRDLSEVVGSKCIQEIKLLPRDQSTVRASQTLCTFKTIYFLLDICTVGTINYMTQMSYTCHTERNLKILVFLVMTRKVWEPWWAASRYTAADLGKDRTHLCTSVSWAAQMQGGKRRLSRAQGVSAVTCNPPPPCLEYPALYQDCVTGPTI